MSDKQLWVIPDIHGELDKLVEVLARLEVEEKIDLTRDKIVFTGDYIDRGPDSRAVLKVVFSLKEQFPNNVVLLAGNHEWLMIDALTQNNFEKTYLWELNGGNDTRWSFRKKPLFPEQKDQCEAFAQADMERYAKQLAALPLFHEEDGFFFSHAPLFEARVHPPHLSAKRELIWNYADNDMAFSLKPTNLIGVCGYIHRLRENVWRPRLLKHYIMADAGCGCHKFAQLFAVEVNTRRMVSSGPRADCRGCGRHQLAASENCPNCGVSG